MQPKLVQLISNETEKKSKEFHQPILVIYSEKYDTQAVMHSDINDLWSKVVKADSLTWNQLSPSTKISNIHDAGHDFPMTFFEDANAVLKSWLTTLKTKQ